MPSIGKQRPYIYLIVDIIKTTTEIIVIAISFGWLIQFVLSLLSARAVKKISDIGPTLKRKWPSISVIIPAANEQDTILPAMDARLRETYPEIEFILVDDRSIDQTGDIMDELARIDDRVKVIHIKELPGGWLGKINAMEQGLKAAKGEWILFSDADVHFKEGTIQRAIYYAEKQGADHVVVAPELWGRNLGLKAVFVVFARLISLLFRAWEVHRSDSKSAGGAGAFNLMKRSALQRTKGLDWIKMEVADDVALGAMLKESGAKSVLLSGRGFVGLHYYDSLSQMASGLERATFTTMGNFRLWQLAGLSFLLILEMTPFLVLFLDLGVYATVAGCSAIVLSLMTHIIFSRAFGSSVWHSFLWPVGTLFILYVSLRAAVLGKIRKGIYWRGTFYGQEDLKRGKRLYF